MGNRVIGQFIDTHVVGGAEVLILELAKRIRGQGAVPLVIHFGNPWIGESCDQVGIHHVIARRHDLYKSFTSLPIFCQYFRRLLTNLRVDLLHSHLIDSILAGALATILSPIKHIGTLHDTHSLTERLSKRLPLRVSALTGTRLVTVSNEMAGFLASTARIPLNRLQVIYNGIDLEKHRPCDRAARRAEFGLAMGDVVVVCVGRLVPVKAHEVLIQAWAMMDTSVKAKLIVIGDGPRRTQLEQMVRERGLAGRIRFLGVRHDVADILKAADVFVLSSHSEGLSCSILEAMATGLPVVATAVGGNPELVHDAINGYLVPSDNPRAFSTRMAELIAKPELRKTFGEASRRLAEKTFSIDNMVEKYAQLYREVLDSRRRCN